jgi:hypothetical protein
LYCLSIFNVPLWLPRWYLLAIALSVHLQFTVWLPLWYLLATLVSDHLQFTFWLPLWYLQTFLHTLELAVCIQNVYNVTIFWVINY